MRRMGVMLRSAILVTVLAGAGVVSGCASVPARGGFTDVQTLVQTRADVRVQWDQGQPEDREAAATVASMLREELTVGAAVQVALLSNAGLQATYEDLGIAQADLVQAGLLQNPVFAASVRFPDPTAKSNSEFGIVQNFLDIFVRPLRKKVAAEQFEQTKFRVSDAVLQLAADVRKAYYTLQGAHHMRVMRQQVMQAAEAAAELARRQREAETINALDLATQQSDYHQAHLDFTMSEAEIIAHREHLDHLMGLSGTEGAWRIVARLPELPRTAPPLAELEDTALEQRLDIAAARQETRILAIAQSVTRFGILPGINIGVNTEREIDSTQVTGPTLELELPIFDQHQAARARVKAQLRQSQQRVAALERDTLSEVRLAYGRLQVARQAVEYYQDAIIPQHEQAVAESQKHYNYMLVGVYALLEAKQDEIMARRDRIAALIDYWVARAELERAMGMQLPRARADVTTPTETGTPHMEPQQPMHDHHGGSP